MRPIVASIGSPTYNLSKMFANILKKVVGNTTRSVKNSTVLVSKLRRIRLPPTYKLISLDIVSLFTNIPNELVYEAINKRWTKIKNFTTLPKDEFLVGVKMVLEECCFQVDVCAGVRRAVRQSKKCQKHAPPSPKFIFSTPIFVAAEN